MYRSLQEALAEFRRDLPMLAERGISWDPGAQPKSYTVDAYKRNWMAMDSNGRPAMDAMPTLSSDPNSAIPIILTTFIDPQIFNVLFAPLAATEIYGEELKGDWTQDTTIFPLVEHTGEVASYGDYNNNGQARANTNWPEVQCYLYQTIIEYGERELARVGLGRISWVSELNVAAVTIMQRAANTIYHFGVDGLQMYGLMNNPYLSAALIPGTKTQGGVTWFAANGVTPNATANEVYNDIIALYQQLVNQSNALIQADSKMTLVLPNTLQGALTFANTFNVNVQDLLKKNFPNLRIVVDTLFAVKSSVNPLGLSGGNLIQLIADSVDGQKTGFCAYNAKMRAFAIVKELSAFKQKFMSGSWGTVIRQPFAVAQMLGA